MLGAPTRSDLGILTLAASFSLSGAACSDSGARNFEPDVVEIRQGLTEIEASTTDSHCAFASHRKRELWGCSYELPVGPRGSATPPSDWGICGITKVSGSSDDASVLRVVVGPRGRYQLLLGVGTPSRQRLDVRLNCVKMSEFSGLPAAPSVRATRDYAVGRGDAPEPAETLTFRKVYVNGGHASDLCLWSGFEGSVNSIPLGDLDSFLFSGSRYDSVRGWSVDAITFGPAAREFTSHCRCDGAETGAWNYYDPVQSWRSSDFRGVFSQYQYGAKTVLDVTPATHFCWLTGISTYGPNMHADLHATVDPLSGISHWVYDGMTTSTMVGIQCLSYAQAAPLRKAAKRYLPSRATAHPVPFAWPLVR